MSRRGISLLDLLSWAPPGAQAVLPDDVASFFEELAILDHNSTTTDAAYIHFGTVQVGDLTLPSLTGSHKTVEAPELNRGVYFRLVFKRKVRDDDENVEPIPTEWLFDLLLDPVSLEFDSLKPAVLIPADGVKPSHLEKVPPPHKPNVNPRKVRLYGRGALRIETNDQGAVDVTIIDFPDPFDPDAPTGPVFEAWFEPPHFFFGDYGFSVGNVIVDFSDSVTPPQIAARGQPSEWRGIALEEATVFFPDSAPIVNGVNVGLRDFIIGTPFGLQGEVFVELGREPDNPVSPVSELVELSTLEGSNEISLAISGSGREFEVQLLRDEPTSVRAVIPPPHPDVTVEWTLPSAKGNPKRVTGFATPFFTAIPGGSLKLHVTRKVDVDGEQRDVADGTTTFEFAADGAPATIVEINLTLDGVSRFENVVMVSGTAEELTGLKLSASEDDSSLRWESDLGDLMRKGPDFTIGKLNAKTDLGLHFLTLRDTHKRTRRILVHVVSQGSLVVGCEEGIFDKDRNELSVHRLKREYDLASFHQVGGLSQTEGGTKIDPASGHMEVPAGVFAEAVLREAGETDPPPIAEGTPTVERVQIIMKYAEHFVITTPLGWGDKQVSDNSKKSAPSQHWDEKSVSNPGWSKKSGTFAGVDAESESELVRKLGVWAAEKIENDPNARFLIYGRTDDLGSETDNGPLAELRAQKVAEMLREGLEQAAPTVTANILARGEQSSIIDPVFENSIPLEILYETEKKILLHYKLMAFADNIDTQLPFSHPLEGRLASELFGEDFRRDRWGKSLKINQDNFPRQIYRRVDVLAAFDAPAPSDSVPSNKADLAADPDLRGRLVFQPGDDLTKLSEPKIPEPSYPYLVRAELAWDSPNYEELGDLIPTKAELTVTWVHQKLKLPNELSDNSDPDGLHPIETPGEGTEHTEFWTIVIRFAFDARSGETIISFSLESKGDPKGLAQVTNKKLAAAFAIVPGLLPLLEDIGLDDGASLLAIAVAAFVSHAFVTEGTVTLEKFEIEHRRRGLTPFTGSTLRAGFDYKADVGWDFPLIGTKPEGQKLEIRYRNVGLIVPTGPVDESTPISLGGVRFVFDEASVHVVNPGEWEIKSPILGKLLRVVATRVGTGSAWIEVDLGLALDLGVIHISQATVRAVLTDDGLDLELRGLEVEIDVPGVLRGEGRLSVDPGGTLASAIELEIIPAGIQASATLTMNGDFFTLQVETQFSTPIPLLSTGLGIFGFSGRFAANGTRNLPAGSVVERELKWFAQDPENRYRAEPGQWAVGLGIIVGTLADKGFSINAKGLLALEVPDLSVVLGVDAQFLKKPEDAREQGDPVSDDLDSEFRLVGLIAINSSAVAIGIRGHYRWRNLIDVNIPFEGFFPFSGSGSFFLRVGSDGYPGDAPDFANARPGDPVSVRILPDSLNATASAFLMIEENGLLALGGRTEPWSFNFNGFTVGAGLHFDIKWGNAFIGVDASADLLAGMSRDPFSVAAGVFIDGEVSFLLLSAGIKGEIAFRYVEGTGGQDDIYQIFGRLCARVGFWRFKKTKCGYVKIPDITNPAITPPSPLLGIDLVNRLDRVVGSAGTNGQNGAVVWPDVIPVLHFSHPLKVDLPADSAFTPGAVEGPRWVGSRDATIAYKLVKVEIRPAGGSALTEPLPSAWTYPTHRRTNLEEGDPDVGDEIRDLHLLSNMRHRWVRNVINGGADLISDPAGNLERVCEPTPEAKPVCVLGQSSLRLSLNRVRMAPQAPSPPPFSSYFEMVIDDTLFEDDLGTLTLELADLGLGIFIGMVLPLPEFLDTEPIHGATASYISTHVLDRGDFVVSFPMRIHLQPEIVEPELILALCQQTLADHPNERCDSYADISGDFTFQTLSHGGLRYEAVQGSQTGFFFGSEAGGERALRYMDQGIRVFLPEPTDSVQATVFHKANDSDDVNPVPTLVIEAFDRQGNEVGSVSDHRSIFDAPRTLQVSDTERRITSVVLSGGFGETYLTRLCYQGFLDERVKELIEEASDGEVPRVVGTRLDDSEVEWLPESLEVPFDPAIVQTCSFVRYIPPVESVWKSVRIGSWTNHQLGIVSMCGVAAEARRRHDEEEQAKSDFIAEWNSQDGPSQFILQADTEYEIEVEWEAITWNRLEVDGKPSVDERTPPNPDSSEALSLPFSSDTQVFSFKTAPEPDPLEAAAPTNVQDESEMDPRQTRRYLTLLAPDADSPPHFPDDPVRVAYSINHLEELLERYGRDLLVKVRRTDPAPGSLAPSGNGALPVTDFAPVNQVAVDFPHDLLPAVDLRILQVIEDNSCLDSKNPEGRAAELFFDLDTNAEYDLLVTAPKSGVIDPPEVVIARSHFRTSRYRNPKELLEAFGFTEPDALPILPIEVLVESSLPNELTEGDAAFDQTLSELALDPWPFSSEPRVVVLMRGVNDAFELAGVLLEANEPIHSSPRLRLGDAEVIMEDGITSFSLTEVRRNTAGTRILLAPTAGVQVNDESVTMQLELIGLREGALQGRRLLTLQGSVLADEVSI